MTARVYVLFLRNIIFSISRIFYIHHSSIRALFFISHFFFFIHRSLIDQGLLHFANIIHLSIDQGFSHSANILHSSFHRSGLFLHFANIIRPSFHCSRPFSCISRISYIHLFIVQGLFLAFREYHTSIFSLFKTFFLHFANIIHPSFYCSGPFFLHISKFIHPFLSLRINLFTFWALIY